MNQNTKKVTEYLRLSQIVGDPSKGITAIVPVCRATIWNWVKQDKFPKPIKLGGNVTVWNAAEISSFLESLSS